MLQSVSSTALYVTLVISQSITIVIIIGYTIYYIRSLLFCAIQKYFVLFIKELQHCQMITMNIPQLLLVHTTKPNQLAGSVVDGFIVNCQFQQLLDIIEQINQILIAINIIDIQNTIVFIWCVQLIVFHSLLNICIIQIIKSVHTLICTYFILFNQGKQASVQGVHCC